MFFQNLIRFLKPGAARRQPQQRWRQSSCGLCVEALDDRIVPAAHSVGDLVASSHVPEPVTITIAKGLGDFTPGTFSATGGIADSGVYQLIDERDTALPSPVVGTAHSILGFTGTEGQITMKSETRFGVVSFDPFVIGEDGHWLIAGGTDAYANLKGEGEFHKLINVTQGEITFTLMGQVHSPNDRVLSENQPALADGHAEALVSQVNAEEVTLMLTADLAAGTRTWTATGAIEDSGAATTVWLHFGATRSPVVSILQIDTQFANADGTGTFTIRRTVLSTADGENFVREGTWHVVDATGIFAGLKGHGKLSGTESGTLVVDTLTGVVMALTW